MTRPEPRLQDLIDLPGAGRAREALREAGHIKDETPEDAPVWEVRLEYTLSCRDTVHVRAATKQAAVRCARDNIDPWGGRIEHTEVDLIRAREAGSDCPVDIVAGEPQG